MRLGTRPTIYVPPDSMLADSLRREGFTTHMVTEPLEVFQGLKLIPFTDPLPEICAVLELGEWGSLVITGCAHPGLTTIVREVVRYTKRVRALIGGFHLMSEPYSVLKNIGEELRELGVEYVAPLHCSGSRTAYIFQDSGLKTMRLRAGDTMILPP